MKTLRGEKKTLHNVFIIIFNLNKDRNTYQEGIFVKIIMYLPKNIGKFIYELLGNVISMVNHKIFPVSITGDGIVDYWNHSVDYWKISRFLTFFKKAFFFSTKVVGGLFICVFHIARWSTE